MARKPLGVHSRDAWDWFFDNVASVTFNSPAVAAKVSYVGLFNNSTDGSVIYVLDFDLHVGTPNADLLIEVASGSQGGTVLTAVQSNPMVPVGFGVATTFASAVCVGQQIHDIWNTGVNSQWGRPRFIAKIPPTYSYFMHNGVQNNALAGSFSWIVLKE